MKAFEQPVRPEDCVLVFGIPTTQQGFFRHLSESSRHDFVPSVCPAWPAYERIVEQFEVALPRISSFGVSVRHDVTFRQFSDSFSDARVVILFSHWVNDAIEFDDGLYHIDRVVSGVPPSYCGVIDLCVCHPDALVMSLRRERDNCLIKRSRSKARVSFWLQFYQILFHTLQKGELAYGDAVTMVAMTFMGIEIETTGGGREAR